MDEYVKVDLGTGHESVDFSNFYRPVFTKVPPAFTS
jgi:hypothetical protein